MVSATLVPYGYTSLRFCAPPQLSTIGHRVTVIDILKLPVSSNLPVISSVKQKTNT